MTTFTICGCFKRKFPMDHSPPADVHTIFNKYSENGLMVPVQFHRFLVEVQGENVSEADAQRIMEAHLPANQVPFIPKLLPSRFNKQNFFDYLFNASDNAAINKSVHHDMNAPISHYFIFTGHNSYLTGNQLSSDCSEKPIIEALRKGVRVIELDLWPNSSKDDVLVLHGRTLTTPVEFQKCINAIKDNAFVKSQYPVIVTFEDHLTPELQAKVAQTVTKTFGDALFYPDSLEGLKEFPSPESLKGRILISTKPPKEYLGAKSGKVPGKVEHNLGIEEAKAPKQSSWGEELSDPTEELITADKDLPVSSEPGHEEESSDEDNEHPEKHQENNAAPEYKKIISIRAGKPKGGSLVDALRATDEYAKRVSLSEPQLVKIAKSHPSQIVQFTGKNFLRIYPKGLRFDSSNYNPIVAWAHGAQMVAVNMQGYGRHLWLVQGFFRANGGCGYVKKPDFLLPQHIGTKPDISSLFSPHKSRPVKTTLKVKVYMGQGWLEHFGKKSFDKFSPPDFYTRIGIAGLKADTVMKETRTIEDNWTPHWDSEYVFPLTVPELALLRIEVHENDMSEKDDFGGQTCLPVTELKTGFRAVPLCDKKGNELSSVRLLLRLEFIPSSS